MAYWAAARSSPQRETLAQHFLEQAGFTVYLPALWDHRVSHGRRIATRKPLFPGYMFCWITAGWWQARYCPGTLGLVMNCDLPARVPDGVIASLRERETDGAVELPRPPRFRTGDRLRVTAGPLAGLTGLYQGQRPRERVEVLLAILGGEQRVTLRIDAVEAAE
jgi:transcriptional antiterminator RfaH